MSCRPRLYVVLHLDKDFKSMFCGKCIYSPSALTPANMDREEEGTRCIEWGMLDGMGYAGWNGVCWMEWGMLDGMGYCKYNWVCWMEWGIVNGMVYSGKGSVSIYVLVSSLKGEDVTIVTIFS